MEDYREMIITIVVQDIYDGISGKVEGESGREETDSTESNGVQKGKDNG